MNDFIVTINSNKHFITLIDEFNAEINGKKIAVQLTALNKNAYLLKYGNKVYEITSNQIEKDRYGFLIDGWYFDSVIRTQLQESANELIKKKYLANNDFKLHAPMPGLILKLHKKSGDKVKKNEPLIIFEAMKMENELRSSADGTIKEVLVKEGDTVEKNSLLLVIG